MSVPRFLVPEIPRSGAVCLPEPESHHAIKVLRMKVGGGVELFDGAGNVGCGTIVAMDRREVTVNVDLQSFQPNDHYGRLTLAVALPKGDRQRGTIEKLTELGADRLIPLNTTYGVAEISDRNVGRLERYAIEACKQSRRNRLLTITESFEVDTLCGEIQKLRQLGVFTWVLHPPSEHGDFETIQSLTSRFRVDPAAGILFAIGPEGGFSDDEVARMIQAGASVLSLGERILRVETAVSVACTLGSLWVGALNGADVLGS